jgi:hypothetical protein
LGQGQKSIFLAYEPYTVAKSGEKQLEVYPDLKEKVY